MTSAQLLRRAERENEAHVELAVARHALEVLQAERPFDAQPALALGRVCTTQDDGAGACAALILARSRARTAPLIAQITLEHAEILRALKRAPEAEALLDAATATLQREDAEDIATPRADRYAALTQLALARGDHSAALHWLRRNKAVVRTDAARRNLDLLDQRLQQPKPR